MMDSQTSGCAADLSSCHTLTPVAPSVAVLKGSLTQDDENEIESLTEQGGRQAGHGRGIEDEESEMALKVMGQNVNVISITIKEKMKHD